MLHWWYCFWLLVGKVAGYFIGRVAGMGNARKYQFSWEQLGDINLGRPNLGPGLRLEIYRLMQFCIRDVIENKYGSIAADEIFQNAGFLAGVEFYKNALGEAASFNDFVMKAQSALREMGVGILRFEESDLEKGRLVITVSEDLDCSGRPETGVEICTFDQGFIAGLLKGFTGKEFDVKEVECWCTGGRTCRFVAELAA
jgi:predicted hydrocarbon binding protein